MKNGRKTAEKRPKKDLIFKLRHELSNIPPVQAGRRVLLANISEAH